MRSIASKLFARVIRFKNAFRLLDNKISSLDVFNVVESCGYTDQPHLIKEFKQFAGRTPKYYYSNEEVLTPFFAELVSKNERELL
jgi:transcriptional regulator GlxA family with amidase domain